MRQVIGADGTTWAFSALGPRDIEHTADVLLCCGSDAEATATLQLPGNWESWPDHWLLTCVNGAHRLGKVRRAVRCYAAFADAPALGLLEARALITLRQLAAGHPSHSIPAASLDAAREVVARLRRLARARGLPPPMQAELIQGAVAALALLGDYGGGKEPTL